MGRRVTVLIREIAFRLYLNICDNNPPTLRTDRRYTIAIRDSRGKSTKHFSSSYFCYSWNTSLTWR